MDEIRFDASRCASVVTGANASSSIDFALTWAAARRGIVLAVLALRRACAGGPAASRRVVERVLAGVARHYRQCAQIGHAGTPAAALAAQIDAASATLATTCHASPRAALAALTTLRLALYPDHGGRHARH